jgi:hypothetical protein
MWDMIEAQESKLLPRASWIMPPSSLQHILRSSPYYLTGEQELSRATIHRTYLLEALRDLDFTLSRNPLFIEAVAQVELLLRWNSISQGVLYIGQPPSTHLLTANDQGTEKVQHIAIECQDIGAGTAREETLQIFAAAVAKFYSPEKLKEAASLGYFIQALKPSLIFCAAKESSSPASRQSLTRAMQASPRLSAQIREEPCREENLNCVDFAGRTYSQKHLPPELAGPISVLGWSLLSELVLECVQDLQESLGCRVPTTSPLLIYQHSRLWLDDLACQSILEAVRGKASLKGWQRAVATIFPLLRAISKRRTSGLNLIQELKSLKAISQYWFCWQEIRRKRDRERLCYEESYERLELEIRQLQAQALGAKKGSALRKNTRNLLGRVTQLARNTLRSALSTYLLRSKLDAYLSASRPSEDFPRFDPYLVPGDSVPTDRTYPETTTTIITADQEQKISEARLRPTQFLKSMADDLHLVTQQHVLLALQIWNQTRALTQVAGEGLANTLAEPEDAYFVSLSQLCAALGMSDPVLGFRAQKQKQVFKRDELNTATNRTDPANEIADLAKRWTDDSTVSWQGNKESHKATLERTSLGAKNHLSVNGPESNKERPFEEKAHPGPMDRKSRELGLKI